MNGAGPSAVALAFAVALVVAASATELSAQAGDLAGAKAEVYKTVGDVQLKLYIFTPADHKATDRRPAIVFFFGGGFVKGSPTQFAQHCRYFASRGMVAITADYRVHDRHGTLPRDSILDGRDALRWVRANADRLGIDPQRIVASGGSAGAMIAACLGVIPTLDPESERHAVSYTPNAMVLFNPAGMGPEPPKRTPAGQKLFPKEILPYHFVREGLPPMIMFFGTEDRFLAPAQQFQKLAQEKGNRCEVLTWEGVGHGFFNFGRQDNKFFLETVAAADRFLASLGYLSGEPTIAEFVKQIDK